MLGSKIIKFLISILNWQVKFSSIFASFFTFMIHYSPVNFKLVHFLFWIKEPNKSPNFWTWTCSGKSLPNSSCHFWKYKSVFLQILHQYSVPSNITPLYFCNLKVLYFGQKQFIKVQFFEIFECFCENLPKSSCRFQNHKRVFLQILHGYSVSWKITPLYFVRSKIVYFARKGPIKVQILETFECSKIQNSPNSFQFWNNKLVFLQILHQSLVLWDIYPL